MRCLRRRPGSDRGSASLELLALLPVLLTFAVIALQAGAAAMGATVASEAAREAARAGSLGRSPLEVRSAAAASLPPGFSLDGPVDYSDSGGEHRVTVRVNIPRLAPMAQLRVTRTAVMPDVDGP